MLATNKAKSMWIKCWNLQLWTPPQKSMVYRHCPYSTRHLKGWQRGSVHLRCVLWQTMSADEIYFLAHSNLSQGVQSGVDSFWLCYHMKQSVLSRCDWSFTLSAGARSRELTCGIPQLNIHQWMGLRELESETPNQKIMKKKTPIHCFSRKISPIHCSPALQLGRGLALTAVVRSFHLGEPGKTLELLEQSGHKEFYGTKQVSFICVYMYVYIYYIILYCIILYYIVLYYIILNYNILYYTTLYYTILY